MNHIENLYCRILKRSLSKEVLDDLDSDALSKLSALMNRKDILDILVESTIIPELVDILNAKIKSDTVENLFDFATHTLNQIIERVPIAKKKIINDTVLQRRMDSLSRILSPDVHVTPCVAVALVGEKLYISANTSHSCDDRKMVALLEKRLGIFRDFIKSLDLSSPVKKFSLLEQKKALDCAMQLMQLGTGVVKGRKYSIVKRLQTDLLKLAQHLLQTQDYTLIDALPIFCFPDPDVEKKQRAKFHAEQYMLDVIKRVLKKEPKIIQQLPIVCGINKLACRCCAEVLDDDPQMIQYRGTSDCIFFNTMDLRTGKKYPVSIQRSTSRDLYPEDSDSEPELDEPVEQKKPLAAKKWTNKVSWFSKNNTNSSEYPQRKCLGGLVK